MGMAMAVRVLDRPPIDEECAEEGAPAASTARRPIRELMRFLPAVCLVLAMRARFVFTPITSDEGGFLAIARAWAGGATLYEDVWVDRPQGLLVVYRLWIALGMGTPEGIRVLAILACIAGAIACGVVAHELFGRRAGVTASLAVGALASVPQYEGFTANGELLSGSIGAVGLALAVRATWNRPSPSLPMLVAAGSVAGAAFTVKQSGFDAFCCAVAAVAWCAASRRWRGRGRLLALPALLAGFAIPVLAALAHGAATGWTRYWYAVYGYRRSKRSALEDINWERFWDTFALARPALLPALAVAVVAGGFAVARGRAGAVLVSLCWLPPAAVAFLLGGQFHRHYWVVFAFPLGTLAGGALGAARTRSARAIGAVVLLAAPIAMAANTLTIPRHDVGRRLSNDTRLVKDEHIAAWFEEHVQEGDVIYARCASAGLYGNLRMEAPFRYLWHDAVAKVPGGISAIGEMLESADRPRFVALYQGFRECDPGRRQEKALRRYYRRVATVDRVPILERRDAPPTVFAPDR
jgi:4-amino-4-deoxy-L-arabinose transferase-like glycosyltransferase